jgi:hypothetical protein
MATQEAQVVWVLGAGFSAGVGGPLLPRLLSTASENDIKVRYTNATKYEAIHSAAATYVRALFQHGLGHEYVVHGRPWNGELMWTEAEEFIDYLDTAAEAREGGTANPHAERLVGIVGATGWKTTTSITDLRATARHLIAAECCAFLEGVDVRAERWKPFRKWARSLGAHDTVVTFNYDRVLEFLSEAQNADATRGGFPSRLFFVQPGIDDDDSGRWQGCAPVFKLHGSVDWRRVNEKSCAIVSNDPTFAISCQDRELAIATPGPSKSREAASMRQLWTLAGNALAEADAIVFVGFRFPETDADAREALLDAIARGPRQVRPTAVAMHIVLGPRGRDSDRLTELLTFAGKRRKGQTFRIEPHHLYGQDFLSVARRDDL